MTDYSELTDRLRAAALLSETGGGEWYQLIHRVREAADAIEALTAGRSPMTDYSELVERLRAEVKYDELLPDQSNMTDDEQLLDEAAAAIEALTAALERCADYR